MTSRLRTGIARIFYSILCRYRILYIEDRDRLDIRYSILSILKYRLDNIFSSILSSIYNILAYYTYVPMRSNHTARITIYYIAIWPILLYSIYWLATTQCEASEQWITEDYAVGCIIGEAENQGLDGMRAHASAIRNRGSTKGVYGCKSQRIKKAPKWVREQAALAWRDSSQYDYVAGADHFGSTIVDSKWIQKMDETMIFVKQVEDVKFYKGRREGRSHENHGTRFNLHSNNGGSSRSEN